MVTIRKIKEKDISIFLDLWKQFIKDHKNIVVKGNFLLKPHITTKKNILDIFKPYLQKIIASKNSTIFLAEFEGKLVGFILLKIYPNNPLFKLDYLGTIDDLFVKKEFRGRGISSKLKDVAIVWFKKKGVAYLSVGAFADNPASLAIYEKWGFFKYRTEFRKNLK
ncbi:MAG: hypothetical protein CVU81_00340 [Euryarchaeota archaeon HGW-Euryarchaeota-1]|nr:MAG: hypothetical protein CVU81_00340 [Euryarchaeota archaeon HGW-Euryarchaeota-1]